MHEHQPQCNLSSIEHSNRLFEFAFSLNSVHQVSTIHILHDKMQPLLYIHITDSNRTDKVICILVYTKQTVAKNIQFIKITTNSIFERKVVMIKLKILIIESYTNIFNALWWALWWKVAFYSYKLTGVWKQEWRFTKKGQLPYDRTFRSVNAASMSSSCMMTSFLRTLMAYTSLVLFISASITCTHNMGLFTLLHTIS